MDNGTTCVCPIILIKHPIAHQAVSSLINNDGATLEEEVIYEPAGGKRKLKVPPLVPRRPEL